MTVAPAFTADLTLVSDFNIDLFRRYLLPALPGCNIHATDFGQVYQTLHTATARESTRKQFGVVWTRPQAVLEEYHKLVSGQSFELADLDRQVQAFAAAVGSFATQCTAVFVIAWLRDPREGHFGLQEWSVERGPSYYLAQANMQLAQAVGEMTDVYLLDGSSWVNSATASAVREKLWYSIKVPYENFTFEKAATEVSAAIHAVLGASKKLLVLDLDNTLWGGIVGDDGWDKLELGGHDWRGEAFLAFQRSLLALSRRGVQLALVSKNEEETALAAIDSHPEMLLRRENFAGWKINWRDKAENILELCKELNLGLNSVVFIDDNPAEQMRVREALPEVLVPAWPTDPTQFVTALTALSCFSPARTTPEDQQRTAMYVAERKRQHQATLATTMEAWLAELQLRVEVEVPPPADRSRVVQLLNKTNQMNLRTRRFSEQELNAWLDGENRSLIAARVQDRYGDYGLTAVLSFEIFDHDGRRLCRVEDFLMSCRIMGREIESVLLHVASRYALVHGCEELCIERIPTEKNMPMQRALETSALEKSNDYCFGWNLAMPYPIPNHVELTSSLPWLA